MQACSAAWFSFRPIRPSGGLHFGGSGDSLFGRVEADRAPIPTSLHLDSKYSAGVIAPPKK